MQVQRADRPASVALWQHTLKSILETLPPIPDTAAWSHLARGGLAGGFDRQSYRSNQACLFLARPKPKLHPQTNSSPAPLTCAWEFDGHRCLVYNPGQAGNVWLNDQLLGPEGRPFQFGDKLRLGTEYIYLESKQTEAGGRLPSFLLAREPMIVPRPSICRCKLPPPPIAPTEMQPAAGATTPRGWSRCNWV